MGAGARRVTQTAVKLKMSGQRHMLDVGLPGLADEWCTSVYPPLHTLPPHPSPTSQTLLCYSAKLLFLQQAGKPGEPPPPSHPHQ